MSGTAWVDGSVAERVAEAVLHAAGGRSVMLRLAADAAVSDAEQLGLATPRFRDAPVGPAAFRKAGSAKTLLLSARAVRVTLKAVGAASVEAMFGTAVGLLIDGELYRIEKAIPMGSVGQPYCWALTLIAPVV